jgi:hypothetical protein
MSFSRATVISCATFFLWIPNSCVLISCTWSRWSSFNLPCWRRQEREQEQVNPIVQPQWSPFRSVHGVCRQYIQGGMRGHCGVVDVFGGGGGGVGGTLTCRVLCLTRRSNRARLAAVTSASICSLDSPLKSAARGGLARQTTELNGRRMAVTDESLWTAVGHALVRGLRQSCAANIAGLPCGPQTGQAGNSARRGTDAL